MPPKTMENNTTRYEGLLSSEVRIQLTDLLKAVAMTTVPQRGNVKRLCSIAIEMLDNAQRHCSKGKVNFTWTLLGNTITIRIENRASAHDAERLMAAVEMVNAMSPDELSAAFRNQLENGTFGEHGGAGLGFIDIARKSQGGINAEVFPLSENEWLCRSQVETQLI